MPSNGLENIVKICVKAGTSAKPLTEALIVSIPNIKIVNPNKILPISCFLSFFVYMIIAIPITAKIGENEEGFNICVRKLPPSIPDKLSIHDVIVVPILAPIMMPTACDSFIMPEFTKPTTITVVAEDD